MLAVIVSLSVFLFGCGQKNEEKSTGEDTNAKTLRVVTDAAYAPFEYMDGDKIIGFDIDMITAVAKEAGYQLKVDHVGWDPVFVEIESKRADLAVSSITINDDRKQSYDFSKPYFISTNKILVPSDSSIQSAEDLKEKIVAVQSGTTGDEVVTKLLGKNNKNIKKFDNNNLAIQELLQGGADAVVADNGVVEQYVKNNPDQHLKVVEDKSQFDQEFYGLMFPKGSQQTTKFNKALNVIFENGKYSEIYQKWFGTEPDIETLQAQQ